MAITNFYNNRSKTLRVNNVSVGDKLTVGTNIIDSDWVVSIVKLSENPLDSEHIKQWSMGVITRLVDSDFVLSVIADSDSLVAQIKAEIQARIDNDSDTLAASKLYSDLLKVDTDSDLVVLENSISSGNLSLISRLDSDSLKLQSLDTFVNVLESRLDSDSLKLQSLDTAVNVLESRLDSDSLKLQSLDTKTNKLKSDLDSDLLVLSSVSGAGTAILDSRIDSDYALVNSKFLIINNRLDSDSLKLQYLDTKANNIKSDLDSDLLVLSSVSGAGTATIVSRIDSDHALVNSKFLVVNNRLDSDSLKLQSLDTRVNKIKSDTDSDSAAIYAELALTTKSVNGIVPDANGNVAVALASVSTGTNDSRNTFLAKEGDVWVVSGDSDSNNDGFAYIYDSDTSAWLRIGTADIAANDARYVNTAGDTMTGVLTLSADPTLAMHASTKQYVDAGVNQAISEVNFLASEVFPRLDSDYALVNSKFASVDSKLTDVNSRLDSDEIKLQSLQTAVNVLSSGASAAALVARIDSDYALVNSKFSVINARVSIVEERLDSEITASAVELTATGLKIASDSDVAVTTPLGNTLKIQSEDSSINTLINSNSTDTVVRISVNVVDGGSF